MKKIIGDEVDNDTPSKVIYSSEWKPVVGFEQFYEVNGFGDVRSIDREVLYKDGRRRVHRGQIVQPYKNKNGYYIIRFKFNGKNYRKSLHRCVAEAWIPNPLNLECVDHINANKLDNRVCNLQWITREGNITKKIEDGTAVVNRGNAKLDWDSVKSLRQYHKDGMTQKELRELFGLSKSQVSKIVLNQVWIETDADVYVDGEKV